jgi:ATP-dependent DNA ligase
VRRNENENLNLKMSRLAFVPLMTAKPVLELPEGDEWEYEAKLDGSPYSGIVTSPEALRC